jgi:hypothetical protein
MKQFEYLRVEGHDTSGALMSQGWERVSVAKRREVVYSYYQREKTK